MAEALNGSFKAEVIEYQGSWRDADHVERAVVRWVGWYNTERLHSALDYLDHLPPEEFEVPTTDPGQPRTPPETTKAGRYGTQCSSLPAPNSVACVNYPRTAADPLRLAPVDYPDETVTVYRKQTVAEIALRQPKPVALLSSDSDDMAKLCGNQVRIIPLWPVGPLRA